MCMYVFILHGSQSLVSASMFLAPCQVLLAQDGVPHFLRNEASFLGGRFLQTMQESDGLYARRVIFVARNKLRNEFLASQNCK